MCSLLLIILMKHAFKHLIQFPTLDSDLTELRIITTKVHFMADVPI